MFICIIFATVGIFCKLIITKYIVEFILVFQWGKRKARTRFALKGSFWICHFFLIKFVTSFSQILKQKKKPVISFLVSLWLSPWEFLAFSFLFFFPPFQENVAIFQLKKTKQTKHFLFSFLIWEFVTFSLQIRLFLLICSLFGTWTTEFLISHKWSHLDILSLVAWGLRMALDTGLVVYVYSLHMIKETYLRS